MEIYSLPKGEKDDKFNGCNFEEWFVFNEIVFELNVKLNKTIHCDGDTTPLNYHNLVTLISLVVSIRKQHFLPKHVQTLGSMTRDSIYLPLEPQRQPKS